MDFRTSSHLLPTPVTHPVLAPQNTDARQQAHGHGRMASTSSVVVGSSTAHNRTLPGQAGPTVKEGAWPFGRLDVGGRVGPQKISAMKQQYGKSEAGDKPQSPGTIGRPKPEITPVSVGRYFRTPVGNWQGDRLATRFKVASNLPRLIEPNLSQNEREQLHLETTLHWHCLSECEKVDVLNTLVSTHPASLGPATGAPNAVRNFLEHTLTSMHPDEALRLFRFCDGTTRTALKSTFAKTKNANEVAAIKQRNADLRNTMPLDHGYDYAGLIWDNNRRIATIPEAAKNKEVLIFGAGTAGITFADFCNRAGMTNFTLMEQSKQIGGRLKTEKWPVSATTPDRALAATEAGRELSPTPLHPGGMRFHQTRGNVYWSYAKHYGLHTQSVEFPNPSRAPVSGIVDDRLIMVYPNGTSTDPVVDKVLKEFKGAYLDRISKPVRATRDAGDSATFFELCNQLKINFDDKALRQAVKDQLTEAGHKWGEPEWKIFDSLGGFGVGGYKGYNYIGSLEEFRLDLDERLDDHKCLIDGADEPLRQILYDDHGLSADQDTLGTHLQTGVELLPGAYKSKEDGKFHLQVRVHSENEGEESVVRDMTCDEFFFTGSPKEAQRLGLTDLAADDNKEPILADRAFATAVKQSNMVNATKMILKIPQDIMEAAGIMPKNIQTSESFGQSYLVPPLPNSTNWVVYPSYLLGNSAEQFVGMSGEDQLKMFVNTLRKVGGQPADPKVPAEHQAEIAAEKQKLVNLANAVEEAYRRSEGKLSFTNWSEEEHLWGAFKGDMPGQLANTEVVSEQAFKPEAKRCFGEEYSSEFGFASGAVKDAADVFMQMAERLGGTKVANAPQGLAPSDRP